MKDAGHLAPRCTQGRARRMRTRSRRTIRTRSSCSCRACSAGSGTGSTTASSSRTSRACESVDEGSEIVYVPCHRSHMDYLLLSYVVYHKGYAVPHIAAGINLNMPVVGSLPAARRRVLPAAQLRAATRLYTAVFMKYLGTMMARGHSIEYFIEGGRSRTGRLLQPKHRHARDDGAQLRARATRGRSSSCRCTSATSGSSKARTYIGELSGPAEGEGVRSSALLRTLPELRSRFGKVYVSFGEPLPLDAAARPPRTGAGRRQPSGADDKPAWLDARSRRPRAAGHGAHQRRGVRHAGQPARHWCCSRRRARAWARPTSCGSSSCMRRCCARRRTRRRSGSRRSMARR